MASPATERAARGRIERACSAPPDPTSLRVQVLRVLRDVVDFDAHVWLLTDPRTAVGSAPLADVPCLPELPELIRLKYLTDVNRWTHLAADGTRVRTLRAATADDPARSLVWNGILRRYGIGDVVSAVFANRFGIWGFMDLWRSDAKPPFDDRDTAFLSSACPAITLASQAVQAQTLTAPAVPAPRELGPVVFLLDDGLRIVSQTPAGQDWLEILLPSGADQAPVPASVYNVAGQLLAVEQGVDDNPATARLHLADGYWVTLRAARLPSAPRGAGTIAVTIEETSPVDRLEVFVRCFALSPRESELVSLLATGYDTRDLTEKMLLSQNTVQDHLKSIFAKTATHSRRSLLSRALGVRGT